MKAVLCPVCNGTGKIPDPDSTVGEKTCHGCHGYGWVTVPGDYPMPVIGYPPPKKFEFPWTGTPTDSDNWCQTDGTQNDSDRSNDLIINSR
ncbi:MAG: hypothetical protein U9O96_00015 [Candidatus Thermoplasmatota archaeon]|nr:hypothetical protein [Candidatus Thermoplasmatota archaeon]